MLIFTLLLSVKNIPHHFSEHSEINQTIIIQLLNHTLTHLPLLTSLKT